MGLLQHSESSTILKRDINKEIQMAAGKKTYISYKSKEARMHTHIATNLKPCANHVAFSGVWASKIAFWSQLQT